MQQSSFFPQSQFDTSFGGSLLKKSHAKVARPFSPKASMHIVLKSSIAHGEYSFLQHRKAMQDLIEKQARKHQVKLYQWQNVGNHLHLLLLTKSRKNLNAFLRSISGLIARLILGVERGKAKGIQFWDSRPFSRLVRWGKNYTRMHWYIKKNEYEASGLSSEKARYMVKIDQLWIKLCETLE